MTNWNDIILTVLSGSSPVMAIIGGLIYYKETRRRKKLDNDALELDIQEKSSHIKIDREKAMQQVRIDDVTHNRLVEEAAILNEEHEQRREDWWFSQIRAIRGEMNAQAKLSNKRFRRVVQLENWATKHIAWDRRAWCKVVEIDPDFEEPPNFPYESEENGD